MAVVKKTFAIEGMHCGACSTGIEMFLSNTEGVVSAKVDYNSKQGVVEYDETKTNDQGIINVVKEAGFSATVAR